MSIVPRALKCDFKVNPIGVGSVRPLLGWQLAEDRTGAGQTAWRVQVREEAGSWSAPLWDSGRVETEAQATAYAGAGLQSNATYQWRVMVWDEAGEPGPWSEAARWRQGLTPGDWRGAWIGDDEGRDGYDPSVPYYCADDFDKGENHPFLPKPALLRSEFSAGAGVASAVLYVSALGLTEVWLNGEKATVGHMIPGICDYRRRAYAFAYDVTGLVRDGENALAAVLADGWYAGYIGLNPRQWWGAKPRLNAELRIEYADGRRQTVATDAGWRACVGPWLYADIMHGAGYDATLEPEGWKLPGYDDAAWRPADTGAEYDHMPEMHPGVPIVEHARYAPREIRWRNEDEAIVDFGRCFAGVICAKLRGPRGARVDFFHAEELTEDGEDLYEYGNRSARCHDCCVLSGGGEEIFQPEFTYHGFRYARVRGLSKVELLSIEGVAISSALPEPTELETGSDTVNAVIQLIRNTEQSNLYDMPTDVCARDERLGWGADGHFFMHTASTLNHIALFLRKWLRDALDGQAEDGSLWAIAPAVMMKDITPFAGDLQSDSALHCAWLLMRRYGDMEPVRQAFPALERYFAYSLANSDRLLRFATAHDWLDLWPDGHSDRDHGYGHCDPTLIGTAWFAHSADMMADIAGALGAADRAAYYREMYEKIRTAFRTFFLRRDNLLRGATQGGYLMAAAFGLIGGEEIAAARDWVQADMRACGGITWGITSAPIALTGLCRLGLAREAAAFLRRTRYPSFGYMLSQGATAVWERWDGIYEGKKFPHPMNAFDHIGLASAGAWILSGLAGIEPAADGFARVSIRPVIDPEIGSVRAVYPSVRGPIGVHWRCGAGEARVEVALPAGVTGALALPVEANELRTIRGAEGVSGTHCADGVTAMDLASGRYEFRITLH